MTELVMRFDLRVPPFAATTFARQYAAFREMVRWGDDIGVSSVSVSEHHGDPAGYIYFLDDGRSYLVRERWAHPSDGIQVLEPNEAVPDIHANQVKASDGTDPPIP